MCAVYQYLRETVLLKAAVCPRTQTRTGESQDDPEPASHEGMLAPRRGREAELAEAVSPRGEGKTQRENGNPRRDSVIFGGVGTAASRSRKSQHSRR